MGIALVCTLLGGGHSGGPAEGGHSGSRRYMCKQIQPTRVMVLFCCTEVHIKC